MTPRISSKGPKAKVMAVYPDASCIGAGSMWYVVDDKRTPVGNKGRLFGLPVLGTGPTAAAAWHDALRQQ